MENKYHIFWTIMELCDWSHEGNDDKVLRPVIEHLARQSDAVIFEFEDFMTELLYHLDTRTLAEQCQKTDPYMSDDTFLYARCAALINGPGYYEKVREGKENSVWNMEFESLLYVSRKAWAWKHHSPVEEYPHFAPLSYETGSNQDGWKSFRTDKRSKI